MAKTQKTRVRTMNMDPDTIEVRYNEIVLTEYRAGVPHKRVRICVRDSRLDWLVTHLRKAVNQRIARLKHEIRELEASCVHEELK